MGWEPSAWIPVINAGISNSGPGNGRCLDISFFITDTSMQYPAYYNYIFNDIKQNSVISNP